MTFGSRKPLKIQFSLLLFIKLKLWIYSHVNKFLRNSRVQDKTLLTKKFLTAMGFKIKTV